MSAKRHASLFVLLAVLLFLGAISAPAQAQSVPFLGLTLGPVGTGLNGPMGVAADGAGNIFIADTYNSRVVKVPAGGGAQTTLGTGLYYPIGVAVDGAGNVFIADTYNNRVVEVPASGGAQITVVSGLNGPAGVAVDAAGNVFIGDNGNNRVVKVPAGGGTPTTVGSGLKNPWGVAVDGAGDVFIADAGNNRVVEVPAGGGAQTTVGDGLSQPRGVAVDGGGDVFIADTGNNQVWEFTPAYGLVPVGSGESQPFGVAVDGMGDVFFAEPYYSGVGYVFEVQNNVNFGNVNVCPDGQSAPAPCRLSLTLPYGGGAGYKVAGIKVLTQGEPSPDFTLTDVADDPNNWNEYVTVTFTPTAPGVRMGAVQLLDASGSVLNTTMIHGVGQGPAIAFGPGTQIPVPASGLNHPWGVALDGAGDVFIADEYNSRVVEVRTEGGAQTTVGSGLTYPAGLAVDGAGNVFIADSYNNRVVEVPSGGGAQTTVGSGLNSPFGVAVDGAGDVFIADSNNSRVVRVPAGGNGVYGAQSTVGSGLLYPWGVAVDGAGNVFIADTYHNRVVEVPVGGGQQITLASGLNYPVGVTVDAAGWVFIADTNNNRVVKVPAGGGQQITVASGLNFPTGVAVNEVGDVFIADTGNNRVVTVQRSQPPTLSFASTPIGNTSSSQVVAIQNIGNQPLNAVAPGLTVGPNFVQVPGSGGAPDCTISFALAPGAVCLLGISFEPQSLGNLTAAATVTDNALNFTPYASQSIALQGTGLPSTQSTTTVLWSLLNPSSSGQAVTFVAAILPQVGGQVTGTVTFKDGSATLATVAVSGNAANLTISTLAVGTHSITAVYSGDGNFNGSTSASVSQVVQKSTVGTTTTLTSSVNPSAQGKPVTFTATVSPQSGTGIPTGKVTFYNGTKALATVSLSNGIAKTTTSALPAGSNSITAVYAGDANYATSTSTPVVQLVMVATTVTLSSSPNPSAYGQGVVFTATVMSAIGAPPDGETVTFKKGQTVLGTGTLSSGSATFATSALPVGTVAVTAVYGGDANFASSTSNTLKQLVNKASTTTALASSLNPSNFGQSVTFTASVTPQFSGTVTGTVTFYDGTTALKTVSVNKGVAKFTTSTLASGTHTITATYNGSASFIGSSAPLTQTVN